MTTDPIPPPPPRRRRSWYTPVAWALCIALLAAGSRMQRTLGSLRREYGFAPREVKDVPWQLAFATVALGGFRGLIVDVLWVRAMRKQEDGKYFEMVQLADWITRLEPRFATIWAMHAWNLAYNISVKFPDFEDRWRWVQKGVRLLRDEGLRYNPDEPELYRELGWIFQHKIGGTSDDAHWVYKRHLAEMMTEIFDGPDPDFDELAGAPAVADLAVDPVAGETTAALAEAGFDPARDWFAWRRGELDASAEAIALLEDPARADAIERIGAAVRAARLLDEFRMEPELMREIDETRGPFDWRVPESQAIYWATRGLEVADGEHLPCDRMIFQCMNISFEQGRLIVNEDGTIFRTPNVQLIPSVNRAYVDAIERYPDINIQGAHRNFVRNAIFFLYTFNDRDGARHWLDYAQQTYANDEFNRDLDEYVMDRVVQEVSTGDVEEAQALIEGALTQAFYWFAAGDDDQAAGYEALARLVWTRVQQELGNEILIERMGLPPLARIRDDVLQRCFEQFPPSVVERLRARLATEPESD